MFEISFIPFVIIAALARGARFFIVSALVYFIGNQIKDYVVTYLNIFSIICLSIALLVYIIIRIYKKNKSCATAHNQTKEDIHV